MVKTKLDLFRTEMKISTGRASELVEPVLGIAPEAFNAVQVVSPFGRALVLGDDYMLAGHTQAGVSAPLIRVVERPDSDVLPQQV
jgi:hypothetical protein